MGLAIGVTVLAAGGDSEISEALSLAVDGEASVTTDELEEVVTADEVEAAVAEAVVGSEVAAVSDAEPGGKT